MVGLLTIAPSGQFFIRLRGERVLLVGDGPAADAKARPIEGAGGIVVRGGAAQIAFVALDDADAAAETATRLKAEGRLVNVVDRPALCDFTVPAIVDRSPVIVAVGTGGASASLAKALRERSEALLPAGLGTLTKTIFAARAEVARSHTTIDARRRFWNATLAPGGALDPLGEPGDITAAIIAPSLFEIALTSPDPDDLTLRQLRMLNQADTIYHSADVPAAVLDRARRDAERVEGKAPAIPPAGRSIGLTIAAKRPWP